MPDQSTVRLAIERSHQLNPALVLIARATLAHHVDELRILGVIAAIQPEFEGGLEMVRQALIRCQHDGAASQQILDRLRSELYGSAF